MKKQWIKPQIKTILNIKQTASKNKSGSDGGSGKHTGQKFAGPAS
jgi:hypothetical protein